jgi:hypothetical protein
MQVEPKLTKAQAVDWCPKPRGKEDKGNHARIPAMTNENADTDPKAYEENRQLTREIVAAFQRIKKSDDPKDPERGPRFVIQWRMFANASNPNNGNPDHCGCGCSCACGCG